MRSNLKIAFITLFTISCNSWANSTMGISGVDQEISLGTKALQVFVFLVGLGCLAIAAYLFGSGKAKHQGIEILFGLLTMAAIAIGGSSWWIAQTSGFAF